MRLKIVFSFLAALLFITASSKVFSRGTASTPPGDLPPVVKFDEFRNSNCEDELARMDNFAVQLQTAPDNIGYIVVYGGRAGRENEARAYAARMRYYLTRTRGLDGGRFFTIDGGYRENLTTELWMGHRGGPMPTPSPTVSYKDVTLKGRMKVKGYDCGASLGL